MFLFNVKVDDCLKIMSVSPTFKQCTLQSSASQTFSFLAINLLVHDIIEHF